MAAALNRMAESYARDFPKLSLSQVANSFLGSAVFALISGSTVKVALIAGTIMVIATAIEAIVRPILHALFSPITQTICPKNQYPEVHKYAKNAGPGLVTLFLYQYLYRRLV